jgi:hypothetical protein
LADFDGVSFHVSTDANNKALLNVSLHWRCAKVNQEITLKFRAIIYTPATGSAQERR